MSPSDSSRIDAKARAELRFAKAQTRDRQASDRVREQATAAAQLTAKTERLRALRLARDAEAAEAQVAKSPASKPQTGKSQTGKSQAGKSVSKPAGRGGQP